MKLLTVKQAAEALGVCLSTIYELCSARKIRHERHGIKRGTIRIPQEAIDEYRKSVTVNPEEQTPVRVFRHLK